MSERCKHKVSESRTCGSYAFNLYREGIVQGDLCDVHYWEAEAKKSRLAALREVWDVVENQTPRSSGEIAYQCLLRRKLSRMIAKAEAGR
jgi:hypothetical protein